MSISDELKQKILKIPGENGFWKGNTEWHFLYSAELFIKKGFTEEETLSLLGEFYSCVASEFGQ